MKTIITESERLQLAGLLTMAQQAYRKEMDCIAAARELMASNQYDSFDDWFTEGIWDGLDIDEILKRTGVTVSKPKRGNKK